MNKSKFTFYNSDGSLTSEYRERLKQKGASEAEINRIEEVNMRDVRVDREMAEYRKQYEQEVAEWDRQDQARKQEEERLGITPVVEVLYVSPDKINVNDMNPSQRRSYEMSGLSTEELLSQGYIEPDQLREFSSGSEEDKNPPPQKTDPNLPEIPF
ncbi:MAG: hypothetical protein QNJ32_29530 [Xenococcaceae cyanobacterium MO_167.B27]|nr:hypothetical protein [Xenococcaceae cyanobacterium MO_167.B27]